MELKELGRKAVRMAERNGHEMLAHCKNYFYHNDGSESALSTCVICGAIAFVHTTDNFIGGGAVENNAGCGW